MMRARWESNAPGRFCDCLACRQAGRKRWGRVGTLALALTLYGAAGLFLAWTLFRVCWGFAH